MYLLKHCSAFFVCLSVTFLATPALVHAQEQDFSKVEIETIPVAEGIYMLSGEGGNIGVSAGEDGVFLIDDQFAPLTEKIRAAVNSVSEQPIRFVLNTHWHFDHTGGNENLGDAGVVIVAHDIALRARQKAPGQEAEANCNSVSANLFVLSLMRSAITCENG